jgi:hypothetical protein
MGDCLPNTTKAKAFYMKGFKLQIPGSKTQDKDREFTSKDMECVHASLGSRNKLGACMHAGQIQ